VSQYGVLEFESFKEIYQVGYAYGRKIVGEWVKNERLMHERFGMGAGGGGGPGLPGSGPMLWAVGEEEEGGGGGGLDRTPAYGYPLGSSGASGAGDLLSRSSAQGRTSLEELEGQDGGPLTMDHGESPHSRRASI
jgi:hypothetical protein